MANSKISTLTVPNSSGTAVSYDIDAKYLGGSEPSAFAKVEDLNSKADVYNTGGKLSDVQIGDNLTGQTLRFDTTTSTSSVHPYDRFVITFANGKQILCSWQPSFSINYGIGSDGYPDDMMSTYFARDGAWQLNEYTLSSTEDWTVTNITYTNQMDTPTPIENLPCVNATSYGDFADCKSNYEAIQALKANSGGVYLHYLNIMPTNAMFNVDLFVTTSTPDQITTISQLAEIYGTYKIIACGFNGGSGYDFGYIMCNSTSAISTKSAVNNYTVTNVSTDTFTDTVKQV